MNDSNAKGQMIAAKARAVKFDKAKSITGDVKSGKVKLTPAETELRDVKDLEAGAVVAQMETTAPGDETALPAGRHHVYLVKEGGEWKAYAETDGKVTASAARVTVEHHEKGKAQRATPRITTEGWCSWFYLGWIGPFDIWIVICW